MATHASTVVVVDDEESVRDYLASVLELEGYDALCFSGSVAALKYIDEAERPPDLILADINMPGMTGMELLRSLKQSKPGLPVILVSGLYELALALEAVEVGADDYLRKPVRPSDIVTLVGKYLTAGAVEQEAAICEALEAYLASQQRDPETSEHIQQVFRSLGFKRYETFQHSKRVAAYSRLFGLCFGLEGDALERLELGALLHDIGKIGIPRNVLLKPGPLDAGEWDVMRSHPSIGHRLLSRFEELGEEAAIVYRHHERFDGTGYPGGLKGGQIPLGARMFAIVDTLDAITSDRPYRAKGSFEVARQEIAKMSGKQFDPQLVEAFLKIPAGEFDEIRQRYPDQPEEIRA